MKAATPLVTLAVGLALRLEHPSRATLAGTALIALGTAISTASEAASGGLRLGQPATGVCRRAGDRVGSAAGPLGLLVPAGSCRIGRPPCAGHLHWLSFFAFALSVVFEGLRVVLTERLLGQAKFNAMEALAHLGPCTLALLAAGAYAFEWDRGLSSEVGCGA
jgi:drug/metabolite transporter (DMT)-like permease